MYGSMMSGVLANKVAAFNIKIDSIVLYSALVIVAAVSVILYILAISDWLPSLLIAKRRSSGRIYDRGIKKYVFPEGRGVVYEPGLFSRRYMKKYMLCCHNDKKFIRCMFHNGVRSALFELIIYDNQNKIIKTVDAYAPIGDTPYSEAILLPAQTSHVNVNVIEINGHHVAEAPSEKAWLSRHLWRRRGIFAGLVMLITFLESAILVGTIRYFLDIYLELRFKTTFAEYVGTTGIGFCVAVALIAGIFAAVSGILLHFKKN